MSQIEFSPDGSRVAVVGGNIVSILDVTTGAMVASFDVAVSVGSMSFAATNQLYLGTTSGTLQLLQPSVSGAWTSQQIWRGDAGIRLLQASPRGDYLIVVDANNRARQFELASGTVSESTLQLPSPVQEIVFAPVGPRAWFRTSRWAHVVTVSTGGLTWNDAMHLPRSLKGAGIAFRVNATTGAYQAVMPTAGGGFMELTEIGYDGLERSGLFGSRDALLQEWQSKLSADRPAAF